MIWLITAGPTQEAIDPVRFISNKSSGKMGYAIAEAAAKHGHKVILISGPTALDIPPNIDFISVISANDMWEAVKHVTKTYHPNVAVMCAAVADFSPIEVAPQKMKKDPKIDTISLVLKKNRDILASMRTELDFNGFLMGFAAETQNILQNAQIKLKSKNCDAIVANDVSVPGLGFDSSRNKITIVHPDGEYPLEEDDKSHLGHQLVEWIEKNYSPQP